MQAMRIRYGDETCVGGEKMEGLGDENGRNFCQNLVLAVLMDRAVVVGFVVGCVFWEWISSGKHARSRHKQILHSINSASFLTWTLHLCLLVTVSCISCRLRQAVT